MERRERTTSSGTRTNSLGRASLGLAALLLALVTLIAPTLALAGQPSAGFGIGSSSAMRRTLLEFQEVSGEVWDQPIAEIRFRGNRRVESEAMLLELDSNIGELVTPEKLARDLKKLWALGYFEDVHVEGELGSSGVILTYVVEERPAIRKIIVEGNSKVKLDDINEALELAPNTVLDRAKVQANVTRLEALYTESGFFLADMIPFNPGSRGVFNPLSQVKTAGRLHCADSTPPSTSRVTLAVPPSITSEVIAVAQGRPSSSATIAPVC